MKEKKYFTTNFDYEINLGRIRDGNKISLNKKINREFEYLFFWTEDDNVLVTDEIYSKNYFKYVEKYKDSIPLIENTIKTSKRKYWWGKLEDIPTEMSLNSKVWQNQFFTKRKVNKFIQGHSLKKGDVFTPGNVLCIFRPEFGFAGKGVRIFNSDFLIPENGLVTPFKKKLLDISCFIRNGEFFFYINKISASHSFLTSSIFKYTELFRKELLKRGLCFENIVETAKIGWGEVKNKYKEVEEIQFDMIYTEDHECLINEVNYRRSMGQIGLKIIELFPNLEKIDLNIVKPSQFSHIKKNVVLTPSDKVNYNFVCYLSF